MSIYSSAVSRPITTALIFIAIAIIGVFSFTRLSIDLLPETDPTTIMVITAYPGASAKDIESNVSKVLENSLNSINNLKHIRSVSNENTCIISLEFDPGTDIAEATNDTRDKIDAIRAKLPTGVSNPTIFKFSSSDIPVAFISVQAEESAPALDKILEYNVVNPLMRVDGVGSVAVAGAAERAIHVYCDPKKLESYGLTIAQIAQIIGAENTNIPAGQLDLGSKSQSIRVQGELADPAQLGDIVVASRNGANVYLSEVATLVDGTLERQQENYSNGKRGAMIFVSKQSGANAVAISKLIAEELPKLTQNLPKDVELTYLMDTSRFITSSINSLGQTIAITFIIVMIVVYIFLARASATFIIILTIPVSLIGSFIYLLMSGNSLNIISLSSLSIAIGMVVDDAIVVLENITTHIERGSYPKQAAVHGTNEVGISVVASTLTMLAVFLPLTMVSGQSGLLFRQLGWIISIVMIVSTFAALTLTPMMSSQLLRRSKPKAGKSGRKSMLERILSATDNLYVATLGWALRHRKLTIGLALLTFVGSLSLGGLIKTEFMPKQDNGFVQATIELPVGTRLELTRELGLELTRRWREELPELSVVSMTVGQADASNAFAATQTNGTNVATYNISLIPLAERDRSQEEVVAEMRRIASEYPQIANAIIKDGTGEKGGGNPIDLDIFGYDMTETTLLAGELRQKLLTSPHCAQVTISRKDYNEELHFVFDRQKLAEHGLSLASATSYLRNAMGGVTASYYREDGDEYPIRVSYSPEFRESHEDIKEVLAYTPSGAAVRLGDLGYLEAASTPPSIERKDRSRVVTLGIGLAPGSALSELADDVKKIMQDTELPSGVSYKLGGTYETQQETNSELTLLLALIIILVFIVMAAQFESLSAPFVIMFSVPFAFTGVFLGLIVTQIPMGAMALIGLIMLVGIVVKNGIVLIDYIQLCRERGTSITRSILTSGRSRLRPVLMTTLTTVLGMLPMALGIGEGSEMWQSMGVTVAFGLSVSTLVTLILIPTIYASLEGFRLKRDRIMYAHKLRSKAAERQ
ncbi:MAG: efflux RND transporter permease subunit [Porphyromonadaceae bacterium]|nr:efflux RND transporter permease subunit [Porphyromonadaceae bacterium]